MLVIHNQCILFKENGRTNNAKHLHRSTCGQELNICVSELFFCDFLASIVSDTLVGLKHHMATAQ